MPTLARKYSAKTGQISDANDIRLEPKCSDSILYTVRMRDVKSSGLHVCCIYMKTWISRESLGFQTDRNLFYFDGFYSLHVILAPTC